MNRLLSAEQTVEALYGDLRPWLLDLPELEALAISALQGGAFDDLVRDGVERRLAHYARAREMSSELERREAFAAYSEESARIKRVSSIARIRELFCEAPDDLMPRELISPNFWGAWVERERVLRGR